MTVTDLDDSTAHAVIPSTMIALIVVMARQNELTVRAASAEIAMICVVIPRNCDFGVCRTKKVLPKP